MNSSEYLVTAIVSTYNSEVFIRGCIEDIIRQSIFDNIEIIIVNAASEQFESTIIREYLQKFNNIKYIHLDHNESIYASWNRAIKLAKGKYITNANTDDRHSVNFFEKLSFFLESNPDYDIIYSDQLITNTQNETFEDCTAVDATSWPEFSIHTLFEYCCIGPQPMWRKSIHTRFHLYFNENYNVAGDYDFWLQSSQFCKFKKFNETLGLYYRSPYNLNKEFQDTEKTLNETYATRRSHFLKYIKSFNIFELENYFINTTKQLLDLKHFVFNSNPTGLLYRYLHHKIWELSVILEMGGQYEKSLDLATRHLYLNGYMLQKHIQHLQNHDLQYHNSIEPINLSTLIFWHADLATTRKCVYYELIPLADFEFQDWRTNLNEKLIQTTNSISTLLNHPFFNAQQYSLVEYYYWISAILFIATNDFSKAREVCYDFYKIFCGSAHLSEIYRYILTNNFQTKKTTLDNIISVVIPLYNQGLFLRDSLNSILNQTIQNIEVIIIDDGSTDDSLAIARALAQEHSAHRITVLTHPNKGKGFTRNRGVSESSGKYVCILDADDMLASTYLEEAVGLLEANPETGWITPLTLQFGRVHQIFYHFDFDMADLLTVCPSPVSSVFRRELWDEVGGFDQTMTDREDWEFWIKAAEAGWTSLHTKAPQFLYRIQEKRFGEREDVNVKSKLEIIERHPWWFKPLTRKQLLPFCSEYSTCNLSPDILEVERVTQMIRTPKNRAQRRAIFSEIKNQWSNQRSQNPNHPVSSKTLSYLRLAQHYAEKGDQAKAAFYRAAAEQAK